MTKQDASSLALLAMTAGEPTTPNPRCSRPPGLNSLPACSRDRRDREKPSSHAIRAAVPLPGVAPGCLVDLVDRAARKLVGIVDEDVDVGGILRKRGIVLGLAEVDDMRRGVDLMGEAQALGESFQQIAAAGGKAEMSAFC